MAKVLLVEDDNNLREIYQARLLAEGYDIVVAQNGEEALVVAKQNKPDLIISDVMMPRISGFEMLDILRNTDGLKHTKVIMLTALGQAEDQARANNLGADKYLVKSQVTLEDIVNAAKELLTDTSVLPAAVPAPPATPPVTATPAAMPVAAAPSEPASATTSAIPVEPPAAAIAATPVPEPTAASVVPTTPAPTPTPVSPVATPAVPPAAPSSQPPVEPPVSTLAEATLTPQATAMPVEPSTAVTEPATATSAPSSVTPPTAPIVDTASVMPAETNPVNASATTDDTAQDTTDNNSEAVIEPTPETGSLATPYSTPAPAEAAVQPAAPAEQAIAAVNDAAAQTLEAEEAALQAQIESYSKAPAEDSPQADPTSPVPEPGSNTASNDAAIAEAVEELNAPAVEEPLQPPSVVNAGLDAATTTAAPVEETAAALPTQVVAVPEPAPAAPPPDPVPESVSNPIAGKRVIQPLSKPADKPSLDELLAREQATQPLAPPAPVVGANTSGPVATPSVKPGQTFDPNSAL